MAQGGQGGGGGGQGAPVGSFAASPTHSLGRNAPAPRASVAVKAAVHRRPTAGMTRVKSGALPKLRRGRRG